MRINIEKHDLCDSKLLIEIGKGKANGFIEMFLPFLPKVDSYAVCMNKHSDIVVFYFHTLPLFEENNPFDFLEKKWMILSEE